MYLLIARSQFSMHLEVLPIPTFGSVPRCSTITEANFYATSMSISRPLLTYEGNVSLALAEARPYVKSGEVGAIDDYHP